MQLLPPLSVLIFDKRSLVSAAIGVLSLKLAILNVMHDEHQIKLIGIQKFNNVKMSQICDKNIYFI